ncbi:MAG: hypothetical protein IPM82_31040 [Saprospiraceae bacterium]|nr:hypothetical protein [Saprospiraceae bacterium]
MAIACKGLLEEDPKDQVFVDNFFQTENDAIAAVNAVYSILNSTSSAPTFGGVYHSSYWVAVGLASDEMENQLVGATDLDQLATFTHAQSTAHCTIFGGTPTRASTTPISPSAAYLR